MTQAAARREATVEFRFSALPAHVRTARLVAAAVARRCGIAESDLDEVRLAVGEACSRAVGLHLESCPEEPVLVTMQDGEGSLEVAVHDCVPTPATVPQSPVLDLAGGDDSTGEINLAVIEGLVDDVQVTGGPDGNVVRMRWPVGLSD
jgi:anti-sigma regulatory factor (Ser/Thr protein kinase)